MIDQIMTFITQGDNIIMLVGILMLVVIGIWSMVPTKSWVSRLQEVKIEEKKAEINEFIEIVNEKIIHSIEYSTTYELLQKAVKIRDNVCPIVLSASFDDLGMIESELMFRYEFTEKLTASYFYDPENFQLP